ncbi:MAG: extracellular solute-binding protein, partial [Candidatus Bathyarchaeia archaeon]
LEQAKNLLIQQKRYLKMYAGADLYIPYMANPEATGFWICHVWDGDLYIAKEANPNLVYVLPKEGGMLWVDCMVIPNGAPHPVAAHAWINFFCDPYVSALNTMYIHYASPIKISVEKLVPPWIIQTGMYPLYTEETLEKFEFRKIYTEEERALLLELWTELKMA